VVSLEAGRAIGAIVIAIIPAHALTAQTTHAASTRRWGRRRDRRRRDPALGKTAGTYRQIGWPVAG
jgi:hypothetical protein